MCSSCTDAFISCSRCPVMYVCLGLQRRAGAAGAGARIHDERRGVRAGRDDGGRDAAGAVDGEPDVATHHRALPCADRRDRQEGADAGQRHRDQPRRAQHRGRPGQGAQRERTARSAPRHSDPHQGQHRHGGSHDDDRRLARARGAGARTRRLHRRAPARRGRRAAGQDEPQRVGELPVDAFGERMERARRPGAQPVRARSQRLRIELRDRIGDRRQPRGRRRGHRNGRLDHLSVVHERPGRHQADGRSGQPRGHRADLAHAGHARPDGAYRARCGVAARRDGRRRSSRHGDERERRQSAAGLRDRAGRQCPEGRAPGRAARPVCRLQSAIGSRARRRDREAEGAGRGASRSGGACRTPASTTTASSRC